MYTATVRYGYGNLSKRIYGRYVFEYDNKPDHKRVMEMAIELSNKVFDDSDLFSISAIEIDEVKL
ncbi:hypothetical protein NVP1266O_56 [Vibrio phage 1.266.O._10N.286.52.F9]|nr:hypothetical protein NVP1133O_62 [Vibrio phage 1.133.O._10N.222.51.E4]AUR99505.1 hypothetical protein NVP1266O_56 [Vibrio phage 1.266.O._10N.286.52.F9]